MLEAQIAKLDTELAEQLSPWQASLQLLQTLPGIDAPGAALLLAEIGGDMRCFGSAERLASWAGICPGQQRECRQAQERSHPSGQFVAETIALRNGAGSGTDALQPESQIRIAERAQRLQEIGGGLGT